MITTIPLLKIEIKKGADFKMTAEITDDNDQPINLTGYKAVMQARELPGATVLLEFSSVTGGITIDAPNGLLTFEKGHAVTELLSFQSASYDLMLEDGTGKREIYFSGVIEVYHSISTLG